MARLGRNLIAAATVASLLFGAASVLGFMGRENVFPFNGKNKVTALSYDDYALQFYYGQLGSQFLSEGGVTYGYDPYFMAGYVKTPLYYPSSKPFELSLRLFSRFDPAIVFNLTVFLMLASAPLLMFGAALCFRLSPGERLFVVAASTVPNLMVPMAGWYGIMEAAGMVPYIFASFFSLFVVSLVSCFLTSGGRLAALSLLVTAPLLFMCHPTVALLTALPVSVLYFTNLRRMPFRRHLWLWLVLIAVVAANWPWIKGYILFHHYAELRDFYTPEGRQHFVPKGGLLAPLRIYVPKPKIISLIPPAFGAIGLYAWWRERRIRDLLVFFPQIIFLFAATYYGTNFGLSAVAPGRLTLPLCIYLLFPAAHGLVVTGKQISRWIQRLQPPYMATAVKGLTAFLIVLVVLHLISSGLGTQIWRPYSLPQLQGFAGYNLHARAFMAWLERNTNSSGRILHEETDRMSHQYYGSHMAALIPLFTGRVLANGPAPYPLVKNNFFRFIAGRIRGTPLEEMDTERLLSYLSLYNVHWILCWSTSAKHYFDRLDQARSIGTYDKFVLYRVDTSSSYFLRGSGKIELQETRIVLSDLVPERGAVTIKYHWLESLRTDPPRALEPVFELDDPVPFISIMDPPRKIMIYDDHDFG